MAREYKWTVVDGGINYEVCYIKRGWTDAGKLYVNGQEVILGRATLLQKIGGCDWLFRIGNQDAHLVISGNQIDLAMNGCYITSRKPYLPLAATPNWAWIFVVLCLLLPVVMLGGVLPICLGILGCTLCVKIAFRPGKSTALRVVACIGVTAMIWVMAISAVMMLVGMLY